MAWLIHEAPVKRYIGVPWTPTLSSSGECAFKSERNTRRGEGPEKPVPFHGRCTPDGCNPKKGVVFKTMSEGLKCPWDPCSESIVSSKSLESIVWDEKNEKLGRFIMTLTPFTLKGLNFILFLCKVYYSFIQKMLVRQDGSWFSFSVMILCLFPSSCM